MLILSTQTLDLYLSYIAKRHINSFDFIFFQISGGGLPGEYKFAQFHFHWGSKDLQGSEHAMNGVRNSLKGYKSKIHFKQCRCFKVIQRLSMIVGRTLGRPSLSHTLFLELRLLS